MFNQTPPTSFPSTGVSVVRLVRRNVQRPSPPPSGYTSGVTASTTSSNKKTSPRPRKSCSELVSRCPFDLATIPLTTYVSLATVATVTAVYRSRSVTACRLLRITIVLVRPLTRNCSLPWLGFENKAFLFLANN